MPTSRVLQILTNLYNLTLQDDTELSQNRAPNPNIPL